MANEATPTVPIPQYFKAESLQRFLPNLIGPNKDPLHNRVFLDFKNLTFIAGDGITVLSNTIEWLLKRGVSVSFVNHIPITDPIKYLDDCGFFKTYLGNELSPFATVRETTIPLRKVRPAECHFWLDQDVTCWLAHKLGTTPSSLAEIRTCIKEIFNNIIDHSMEDLGCVHIQWHPNINDIHIAISDFGWGIPASIRQKFTVDDDGDAILLATQEGVTTKSVSGNYGAGLSILIDYVVSRNGGKVDIYSGSGALTCEPSTSGVQKRKKVWNCYYPGTLFNIHLRTDTLERIEDEREDFEWL